MVTIFLLVCLLFVGISGENPEIKLSKFSLNKVVYPENLKENPMLKNFIKIVEANKMNVTIIVSQGKHYKNGVKKEEMAWSLTLPVNNEKLTKSSFTKEQGMNFMKMTSEAKLPAAVTRWIDGKTVVWINKKNTIPVTEMLKLFSRVNKGRTGFVFDETNYVAQHIFTVEGADGKNETIKVLHGDLQVSINDNVGLGDEELEVIKKTVVNAFYTYADNLVPRAIVNMLDKTLTGGDWQVITKVGNNSYLGDVKKKVLVTLPNTRYLIYSV